MFPHREAGRCIAFTVLRIPGKTGRHDLKFYAVRLKQIALAVGPFPLDKLHHTHFLTVPNGAGGGPKSRRRFPFSISGKHNDDTALVLGCSDAGVNLFFQSLLALLMAIFTH
ncbi:hypothetical protein D3C86_1849780 [compost metagenome]